MSICVSMHKCLCLCHAHAFAFPLSCQSSVPGDIPTLVLAPLFFDSDLP